MKRRKLAMGLTVAATLCLCAVSVRAAENSYAGTWVLDREASKELSSHVKGYDMQVNQDGQQLVVTTQPHGIGAVSDSVSSRSADINALEVKQANRGTTGGSRSMIGSDGASNETVYFIGSLAFQTLVPQVTYTLDGKKTTVTLVGSGQATLTAKPGKNGKSLDLSVTHLEPAAGQLITALVAKERWTLSEDGQVLKVQRTVSTQQTSETVNLVFRRKSGAPQP